MTMPNELGTCNKKQYEHSGPHEKVFDVCQSMPPFPCENWQPIPAATSEAPEHLCDELRWIDERLSRRSALDGLTTRAAKIERMCSVASRAEKAEADLRECKRANAELTAKLAAAHEALKMCKACLGECDCEMGATKHEAKLLAFNALTDSAPAVAAFRARVLREYADKLVELDNYSKTTSCEPWIKWLRAEAEKEIK
jgi:hypothetical protein